MCSYRKPEITDTEVGKQLWEVTEKLIATVEKESAKRRAVEKKSRPETAETRAEEAQEKERREKLRKKAEEAEIRKKLLDKLIKEDDEKRMSSMDMPSRVLRLPTTPQKKSSGGAPDTPARNTRSKSKTPQTPAPEVGSLEEGSEKSAARRRTKKA